MAFSNFQVNFYALLAGLAYGLLCRLAFTARWPGDSLKIMTVSFLALMPLATGFITAFLAARATNLRGPKIWLGLPLVTTSCFLVGAFVLLWEGLICLVMYLPLGLVMSVTGGVAGVYFARRYPRAPLLCIGVLPFIVSPIEQWIGPTRDLRVVETIEDHLI